MKKVLLGIGIVVLVVGVAAGTIFALRAFNGDPSDDKDTQQLPAGDPKELEQKANGMAESDPEGASELYSDAQQLYEASGEDAKASEMQDNAATTAPKPGDDAAPTAEPPLVMGTR